MTQGDGGGATCGGYNQPPCDSSGDGGGSGDGEGDGTGGGGGKPKKSPNKPNGSVANCENLPNGGFDCDLLLTPSDASDLYGSLLWDQAKIVGLAAALTFILGYFFVGPALAMGILPGVLLIAAIVGVDIYAFNETAQIESIRGEIDDGLDNQSEGQMFIPFTIVRQSEDGPISFGWAGGNHSKTITGPLAQQAVLDMLNNTTMIYK
jgi:hypothetical protein